jgi:histidine ammonia-lyase
VQDPYSFRCAPQVHGAVRDGLEDAARTFTVELNAVTDNPLVFPEQGEVISGGNFHAQPVALAADRIAAVVTNLAAISERRIENLVNPDLSGRPAFLSDHPGLGSGFMIPQVVAAALVSECKAHAFPAAVDSIPTSANVEDHVSMGPLAARKALHVVENAEYVCAIELLTACQALDFESTLRSSPPLAAVHRFVRRRYPHVGEDRSLHREIEQAAVWVRDATLLQVAAQAGVEVR